MAIISSIADKKACSGANTANTGKLGCLSLFGTPEHLLALRKGTTIPAATDFNIAYITPLVQNGTIIPLIGASAFEDVSAEDTYSTNSSGIKRLNLKGLPEYKLMFEEGHEFYKELAELEGYKSYDFIIGDDEGNWMLVENSSGDYHGFTAGHHTPELTMRKVKGGDAESKSLLVQFLDRLEWDKNYVILHQDQLGFVPNDIPAVNGVNLSFNAVPADLGTTVSINAVLSSDNNTPVEGLTDDTNWKATIDGTTDNAVTGVTEDTPGNYTLTLSALSSGESLKIDLEDSLTSTPVAISGGVLYRSDDGATEVVV